jgi:GNAT superfamily N-acetyltransferase
VHPYEHILSDGTALRVRLAASGDGALFAQGFSELSVGSIRDRFHSANFRPTPAQLDYLTDVDQENHLAVCAGTMEGGLEHGVGVARCIRVGTGDTAELAVTVIDDYQRRGIASLLMMALAPLAAANNIRFFTALVMAERRDLLRHLYTVCARPTRIHGGVAEIVIPVSRLLTPGSA